MECHIRKHDDRQFEVKVAYPLDRHGARERYRLEMFLFLPYQLGVDAATWTKDEFYEDLRSYTRYKTPEISLRDLANPDVPASPLTRITRLAADGASSGRWDEPRLIYELRTMACIIRAQVRDAGRRIRSLVRKEQAVRPWDDIAAQTDQLLADLAPVLANLRRLRDRLNASSAPEAVRAACDRADEYVSIQVEQLLLGLLRFLEMKTGAERAPAETKKRLGEAILAESAHRRDCGYVTLISGKAARDERFLHRESLLKKFCSGVLFLSVEQRNAGRRTLQVFYGIAAGVSMAFAVAAAWLAGRYYQPNTLAFGVVLVVAYILKDRIKDLARNAATRMAPRWASDRDGKLIDRQHGNLVGRTHETLRWRLPSELSPELRKAAEPSDALERDVAAQTGLVVHYSKDVRIHPRVIYRSHQRAAAIDEILRLNVGNWLSHMDNPRKPVLALRPGAGSVARILSPCVYYVTLAVRLTCPATGERTLRRACLVLDQNGLVRVENGHDGHNRAPDHDTSSPLRKSF